MVSIKLKAVALAGAVCSALAVLAAPNFPVGTLFLSGSVRNYLNELYTSDNAIVVQAVTTNGFVIAETQVMSALNGSTGRNFLLEVPVTSIATHSSVAPGDRLNLFVKDGPSLGVAVGAVENVKPNTEITLTLRVVNAVSFDSSSMYTNELGKVFVSKEYLDLWNVYTDEPFSPDLDADGDGASNYFEYLCGTNPFDPSDHLAIKSFRMMDSGRAAIGFEYVGGHVYSVLESPSLERPKWAKSKLTVQSDDESTDRKTIVFAGKDEDCGEAVIYVVPTSTGPSAFFAVKPE